MPDFDEFSKQLGDKLQRPRVALADKPARKSARQYAVAVDWGGEERQSVVTARSRGGAKYDVFLDLDGVAPDLTFGDFLKLVKSVRICGRRPASSR